MHGIASQAGYPNPYNYLPELLPVSGGIRASWKRYLSVHLYP